MFLTLKKVVPTSKTFEKRWYKLFGNGVKLPRTRSICDMYGEGGSVKCSGTQRRVAYPRHYVVALRKKRERPHPR